MKSFSSIIKSYLEAKDRFDERLSLARSVSGREKWRRLSQLNECAYYVLLFAQLEDRINELCQKLVKRKQAHANWAQRRLWDNIDGGEIHRLPFMQRTALLTEKGLSTYNTIREMYEDRNLIAHGRLIALEIHIPAIANEIQEIAKQLHTK